MSARASSNDHLAKKMRFTYIAPEASQVHLVGDFNDWDPLSHPMKRQSDGGWWLEVPLNRGQHHYRFLVDGKPVLDPRAQGTARDHQGQKVSSLAID